MYIIDFDSKSKMWIVSSMSFAAIASFSRCSDAICYVKEKNGLIIW